MRRVITIVFSAWLAATWAGHTAVSNTGTVEAAALQTPERMTPDDLEKRMKDIGVAFPAMRTHLMEGKLSDAAGDAERLATLLGDVERFWAENKRTDAVRWAQQVRTLAVEVAGAATANDGPKALRAAGSMTATCQQCHRAYRDTDEAGSFRIRPGALAAG